MCKKIVRGLHERKPGRRGRQRIARRKQSSAISRKRTLWTVGVGRMQIMRRKGPIRTGGFQKDRSTEATTLLGVEVFPHKPNSFGMVACAIEGFIQGKGLPGLDGAGMGKTGAENGSLMALKGEGHVENRVLLPASQGRIPLRCSMLGNEGEFSS